MQISLSFYDCLFTHFFLCSLANSTPAYDHAPNPDKQWILRTTQQMKAVHRRFTDLLMTKRLQTLQSVDTAVERVYQVNSNDNIHDRQRRSYLSFDSFHFYSNRS